MKYVAVIFALAMMASVSKGDSKFNKNSVKFASSLYQKLAAKEENKNVIFSPYSIHTILGLVYLGAEGQTAEEMVDGLHLTTKDKSVHSELFKDSIAVYENNPAVTSANKVYVKSGQEILESFEIIAKDKFKSEIENINFAENRESAAMINNWVENKTNNKIKDLISSNDIDDATQMVLVNTLHFKSDWKNKFNKHRTTKEKFWSNPSDSNDVDMMSTSLEFFKGMYSNGLKATAVQLPFADTSISMMIILPDERDGLSHLEAGLTNDMILDLYTSIGDDLIFNIIKMPKFKIESSIELGDTLKDMGMPTMFSDESDFSGFLKTKQKLKVSKVVHKAVIDANEDGVEAAAATEMPRLELKEIQKVYYSSMLNPMQNLWSKVIANAKSNIRVRNVADTGIAFTHLSATVSLTPPREFLVDHPFFFAIMDDNGILFAGRVKNL